ncbi:MAG: hypothetical protein ACU836_14840 [Gammaproteobacteria bacterium]
MSDNLARVEALRIPVAQPGTPADWKDWYHFVLLHPASGMRALCNVNLTGGRWPELQTTLVVHLPEQDGNLCCYGATASQDRLNGMVSAQPLTIRGQQLELTYQHGHFVLQIADAGLVLAMTAKVQAQPILVTEASPFGTGFIGWGLVPGLRVAGKLRVCECDFQLNRDWFCYQDHNFGRFLWGDDIGWEWFVVHGVCSGGPALTVVLDIRTDRSHTQAGLAYLFICIDGALSKVFVGRSLRVVWHWSQQATLPLRLPGAMATLAADITARQPLAVEISAADEKDRISLQIAIDSFVELLAPDNQRPQYSRIAEIGGTAELELGFQDRRYQARGLAYGEYTH